MQYPSPKYALMFSAAYRSQILLSMLFEEKHRAAGVMCSFNINPRAHGMYRPPCVYQSAYFSPSPHLRREKVADPYYFGLSNINGPRPNQDYDFEITTD